MSHAILVTGGAGYIGSHAVLSLRAAGFRPVVLDDLSTGDSRNVPADTPLVQGSVSDVALVRATLRSYRIEAVLHFAGSIVVADSVSDPLRYYNNNTSASRNLVEACLAENVIKLVFSSTAAVYGTPPIVPIPEEAPTAPHSPYGSSKLMTEWLLRDTAAVTPLRYVALRYFNVAGADPQGRTGQSNPAATHLIKVAAQVVHNLRPNLSIFGTDYDTPDGTCIRDYIHVTDLADAHVLALRYLLESGGSTVMNCGYGRGYSVLEVVRAIEKFRGQPIPKTFSARRPGDVPRLVADPQKIGRVLGWRPRHEDLNEIIASALKWESHLLQTPPRKRTAQSYDLRVSA